MGPLAAPFVIRGQGYTDGVAFGPMGDCRFCAIGAGERDAHLLVEDDRTVAFLDADPVTIGHSLVIPKRHAGDLLSLEEGDCVAVMRTTRALATAMQSVLDPDGFSLFHTTGDLVGTVEHAHLHVVPRATDDDINISIDRTPIDDATERKLAARLRAELGDGEAVTD